MNLKILDCTLRDGGYYTNWNFSNQIVELYFSAISKLPINTVEVGYISNNKKSKFGLYYHLNKLILKNLKSKLRNGQKICCMVNFKEINNHLELIELLSKFNNIIDKVRFAIDPKRINHFLKIINLTKKKVKNIEFDVNLMYLSKWYDHQLFVKSLLSKLQKFDGVISFVDSYGSLKPSQVTNFFNNVSKINSNLKIGCHFHNNCGLALANTLAAIEAGCQNADCTITGMGRGAGNAETELLLSILKPEKINLSSYEFDETLEEFKKLKEELKWGSSFSYSLSAVRGFSQSEMMDLLQKRRLDSSIALTAISSNLKKNNVVHFDEINKLNFLKKNIPILVGGAPSFLKKGKDLLQNIKDDIVIILSGSNSFKNFKKLNIKLKNKILLILSGSEMKKIKEIKNKNFLKKYNVDYLIVEKDFYSQNLKKFRKKIILSDSTALNPLYLAGKLLIKLKVKALNLAFFDGDHNSQKGRTVMKETTESLEGIKHQIKIHSFTETFLPVKQINLWNNDKFLFTN